MLFEICDKFEITEVIKRVNELGKLDDDLKSEISGFSDQGECDEELRKVESLKELLPNWEWDDVFGEIDDAEKRIKQEEDESDYDGDYEQWQAQSEKEDAQIDEMFEALRWN